MSTDDDVAVEEEKGSYGLLWRALIFLFITGPGTVIAFGLWVRIGAGVSITAAISRGDWSLILILSLWLLGILGSAFAIFKR